MVNTPVELVNSACEGIVPINEIRRDSSSHGLFTAIADMLDPVRTGPLLGDLLFLVIEPLQGLEGMVDIGPPSIHGPVGRRWYRVVGEVFANTNYKHWQWSCTWPSDLQ